MVWHLPEFEALMKEELVVKFDQCMWGLALPGEGKPERIKKPTALLTSVPELALLSRKCDLEHSHHRCMGTLKHEGRWINVSTYASSYPAVLCKAWSEAIWARLVSRSFDPSPLAGPSRAACAAYQ